MDMDLIFILSVDSVLSSSNITYTAKEELKVFHTQPKILHAKL